MSLVMSSGKSLTHDNYAVIVFNLFGLCGPLNTQIYTPSPCLLPPHPPQTVQLARNRLHALNDHMHLSVSAQLMIMMAVCVLFFLSVCVPPCVCVCTHNLVTCNCRRSSVCLRDMIHISSKHTQAFPGLQTNDG